MKKLRTILTSLVLIMGLCLTPIMSNLIFVYANIDAQTAYRNLLTTCVAGEYTSIANKQHIVVSTNQYKTSGGGSISYSSLWDLANVQQEAKTPGVAATYQGTALDGLGSGGNYAQFFKDKEFKSLTNSGKKAFITDVLTICSAMAADTELVGSDESLTGVTDETVSAFMEQMSAQAGMGTTMLTSILQNTRPDYTSANRLYQPFSGVVGTILGLISILIMALLGISMALDIAYLVIPAFNMMCTGNETGGQGGNGDKPSTIGGLISKEAKKAYKAADGGEGGQGQGGSGEYKAAVGQYFKYRWTGLLLLGICLLYLVQGQIYTLVAWVIDLASGFMDF